MSECAEQETSYFAEEHLIGFLSLRKTKAADDWMRWQAGVLNEGVFRLLGYGKTQQEALAMAHHRRKFYHASHPAA